jgi:hypothetical protein
METYAYVFSSDEGEEQQRNIKFISKEPEITPDGKKGFCLTLDNVPLVFSAYMQWSWISGGPMATNILLKMSPYHWWKHPPTYPNMPLKHKIEYDFLIAAFQKREVNQSIRQQKHKLYASLDTQKAESSSMTRDGLSKLLTHIKDCLKVEKGNYFPTPPPPEKCNYNKYIVFERQQAITREIHHRSERKKIRKWKEHRKVSHK